MSQTDNSQFLNDQLVRIEAVAQLTTLSKSCINLWVAQGKFPRPTCLSKTVKVWRMGQLRAWMNDVFDSQGDDICASRPLTDSKEDHETDF
jgi:predicted DNA-binding transcriptional regulator AlpA